MLHWCMTDTNMQWVSEIAMEDTGERSKDAERNKNEQRWQNGLLTELRAITTPQLLYRSKSSIFPDSYRHQKLARSSNRYVVPDSLTLVKRLGWHPLS